MNIKGFPDFRYTWLNDERTRLSVAFHGEVPEAIDPDGKAVPDAGLVDWPSDAAISKAVGRTVDFADAGDDPSRPEAIFHARPGAYSPTITPGATMNPIPAIPASIKASQREIGALSARSFCDDPDLARDVDAFVAERDNDNDWNLSDEAEAWLKKAGLGLDAYEAERLRRALVEVSKAAEAVELRRLADAV